MAYREDVGRRLHGVAAGLGRLAGWLAYNSDQHALAQRFWLRAAYASGERATGANVLGFMVWCKRRCPIWFLEINPGDNTDSLKGRQESRSPPVSPGF